MIKTKNGMTKIDGTLPDLLLDFAGTAEALLKNTPFTVEALHAAIDVAKIVVTLGESDDAFNADEVDEEPEAEIEPVDEKTTEKKYRVRTGSFEADDLDRMLKWLKGELEDLRETFNEGDAE